MEKIKNKVVGWITKKAGGNVTVFKPKPDKLDIKGTDFIVKKRGEYKGRAVHIQVKGCTSLYENKIFIKDIQQDSFEPREDFYLIFAYFDLAEQDLSDYIWLVPSLEFRDIAEPVTSESGEPLLRFEAPISLRKRNKYTKFLTNKKDLAQVLVEIATSEKFEFPEIGPQEIQIINLKELKKFISEARRNTYAGEGKMVDSPRLGGSAQMEYQKGGYLYRDIYFSGEKNFIGQEVVYQNNSPVWSMVYCGSAEPKEVSDFLKKSLSSLSEKCRFGEKCEFEKTPFRYEDKGEGTLGQFNGEEKIFIKEKNVYKLRYQGGLILKKC